MLAVEHEHAGTLGALHVRNRASAVNLLHYVGLRRCDIRDMQKRLAATGLSSLGRAESHVLGTVDSVLDVLHRLADRERGEPEQSLLPVTFREGRALLEENTGALLGEKPARRFVRIMVTMPGEAAVDASLVSSLVRGGMDCMRINCAHDGPGEWKRMIEHLRAAERETGRSCRVLMDLSGPKLRTGAIEAESAALHMTPERDAMGRVTAPGLVWIHSAGNPLAAPTGTDGAKVAHLPMEGWWPSDPVVGEVIELRDTRGANRELIVKEVTLRGVLAACERSTYLFTGVVLRLRRSGHEVRVAALPPADGFIVVRQEDRVVLTADATPGCAARRSGDGRVLDPARVPCTLPGVIAALKPGEPIWFDDGKIGGEVESVAEDRCTVRITHARDKGEKLRPDKGINLPVSELGLSCMTERDLEHLPFAVRHADMIGLSFVRVPDDITLIQKHLAELGAPDKAIVMKIENRQAFENLPSLLLAAMRSPHFGVMIARGDLAVECGYERLAELQEEILWLCEAAHAPVIWATQVLETLTRKGVPSRAEVTDAAMGERAECVMLNKGPHVIEAMRVLDNILRRMQEHQNKKSPKLRPLRF